MILVLAIVSWMWHQKHKQKQEQTNGTTSDEEVSAQQRKLSKEKRQPTEL